ncbi:MAG: response regulator [Ignavibacteriaceae bacterium]
MSKLLVIEDEDDIRENIREIFEFTGYEVISAARGADGIKLAVKYNPDLILCDIAMPELDGFEVKKALSDKKQTSVIPFIFLTARADIKSIREGLELGADDYIVKPIHANELVTAVNKRMDRISELRAAQKNNTPSKKLTIDDKIPLNTGKGLLFVLVNNIVAVSVKEDYTMVFTSEAKKIIIKKTIKSWESILPEKIFIRAHRNIIINMNYIEKLEPWFNGTLIGKLRNYPESIKFSKRYSQKVKKMLKYK